MSALHKAISEWNDDQIMWLLNHGADANEPDEEGNTPLMLAVSRGIYSQQIEELLERGADIHAVNRSGKTSLMLALENGSTGSVGVLLEKYLLAGETPEVDSHYEQGRLALLFAIYNNDVEAAEAILDAGADLDAKNHQGRTPLMMAVELGHAEVAANLLLRGANVNARETNGNHWTALHIAAFQTHLESARLLLETGAEVDARDDEQFTPLLWAAFGSSAPVLRILLEYGADVHVETIEGTSALSQAGWLGDADTIRTLLEWGAASHTEHLRDAFHAAFIDNNQDKVPLFIEAGLKIGLSEAILLENGSQIETLLADGVEQDEINRALITAVAHASPKIVRLLLEHGADPNAAHGDQTALMQAYWNFSHGFDNIDVLLQTGADVNARDDRGETPFTLQTGWSLSEKGRLSLMRKMLKYGADIDAQSVEGTTALMNAARSGEASVVRFLLKNGAQINLRDKEGRTSLMFAVKEGHTQLARLLLDHGALFTERANDGSTALILAERWVGKKITKMLLEAGATL